MKPLRWGICGAGKISNDFVNAISLLPDKHAVQAVAARSADRAAEFAKEHAILKYYASYDALVNDTNIDVVYVGVVNSNHEHVVLAALDAGKHVLCEKPLGINAASAKRMIHTAKSKKLFLMEAYWTRYFPAIKQLVEELDSGVIGDAKIVSCNFGFELVGEFMKLEAGGGTMAVVGCYCPLLASIALFHGQRFEKPTKIIASGFLDNNGVDKTGSVILEYSRGRMATFVFTAETRTPNDAYIGGTEGFIQIPEYFWCPTKLVTPRRTYDFPLPPAGDKKFFYVHSVGLQYEAECVRECIEKGHTECPWMSLENTLVLAEINDEIRKQLGVRFAQDSE